MEALKTVQEFAKHLAPEGHALFAWAPIRDDYGDVEQLWVGFTRTDQPEDQGIWGDELIAANKLPKEVSKALRGILDFEDLERLYAEVLSGSPDSYPLGYWLLEDGTLGVIVVTPLKEDPKRDQITYLPYSEVRKALKSAQEMYEGSAYECPHCGGSGGGPDDALKCHACNGTGRPTPGAFEPIPDWLARSLYVAGLD